MGYGLIMRTGGGGSGGTDLSAVTAMADDVVAPKVIVDKDGNRVTGTIQKQEAMIFNAGTAQKVIDVNEKYMTGNITVPGVPLPSADIIKYGVLYTGAGGEGVEGDLSYAIEDYQVFRGTATINNCSSSYDFHYFISDDDGYTNLIFEKYFNYSGEYDIAMMGIEIKRDYHLYKFRVLLSNYMPKRIIACCNNSTHPSLCKVSINPVKEKYVEGYTVKISAGMIEEHPSDLGREDISYIISYYMTIGATSVTRR